MKFPRTETDLNNAGYKFKNTGKCSKCHAAVEWWDTPKGKFIPLDEGSHEPHWATCPFAEDFRK